MSIYPTKKQLDHLALQKPRLFVQYVVLSKAKAWAKYMRNADKKSFKLYADHGKSLHGSFLWDVTPEGDGYWSQFAVNIRNVLDKVKKEN